MASFSNPDNFNKRLNQLIRLSRLDLLKSKVDQPFHHCLCQLEQLLPGVVNPQTATSLQFEQIVRSPLTLPDRTTIWLEVPVSYYGHEKFVMVCPGFLTRILEPHEIDKIASGEERK